MPRRPPELTAGWLRAEASRYLGRYQPSERRMGEVLRRRVRRCVEEGTGTWAEGLDLVDQLVAELREQRVLDDARLARAWVRNLHRRGTSRRAILHKVAQKGIPRPLVEQALLDFDAEEAEGVDPELVRAVAYVRRRRLGPMRHDPEQRRARRERDLAAVARAGFPFGVALRVIDAEDLDGVLDAAR